ncbi:MAG: type IV pilus assembly protein FimV, partial [Rudaea sp.]
MKSSLAVALALATGQVAALGLGPIQVKSGLNQPLVAEIAVTTDSPAEANDLRVDLATAEDFQRVGLNRDRVGTPIDFAVASNGRGQTLIKVTTKEAVREPFLDFLIEVNWGKGKLLREYTVLLDPPVTAPAIVTTSKPVAAPAPAETRPVARPRPVEAKPAVAPSAPAVAAKPAPPRAPAPAGKPAAAPASAAGQYGPVTRGETLSAIARDLDISDGADLDQVMLALLKANPTAFYRNNINALKAGAVLRIPSADEIRNAGSLRDAAAAVREQTQSWREASQPALATHTGAP